MNRITKDNMDDLAQNLRNQLERKKYYLLFAYNGIGKTRLSMAFKDIGKQEDSRDTLYFNAFTEDLFTWDNDLEGDSIRILALNSKSRFFDGLKELEMDTRIRPFLHRYADFDFSIDYENWTISFFREDQGRTVEHIKISRGEENIFIWCFFLAILELVLDDNEREGPYKWVKYIYIDDPICSLDEHNAIAVACNLVKLLKESADSLRFVISTHHPLFFNVLCNELKNAKKEFLSRNGQSEGYVIRDTSNTPFFHHVAVLSELHEAAQKGELYTHHFSMLRSILEKTASFHGYQNFSACIRGQDGDDGLHTRIINFLNHGGYSLYEPQEMLEENEDHFRKILYHFLDLYSFNPEIFPEVPEGEEVL